LVVRTTVGWTQLPVENGEKATEDMVVENETVLSDITNETVTKKSDQQSAPPSPFSKHLSLPSIDRSTTPRFHKISMPKAITGSAYRKLLQEKKFQREELEKEKEERKHERMVKRKIKEDEKIKNKAEKDAKRKEQAEKKTKKTRTTRKAFAVTRKLR